MKKLIAALSCALLAASSAALAQDKAKNEPSEKQKAQQQKMKDCNKQVADKKMQGDARKSFMSSCLKG